MKKKKPKKKVIKIKPFQELPFLVNIIRNGQS